MSGALMQLAAIGLQHINHKNRYALEYVSLEFHDNTLVIPRNADLCIPLHFQNYIHSISLCVPLHFLTYFHTISVCVL